MADSQQEAEASAANSRAKILEGVDFIETEEDAEAVESAVVKIQSTFRGKKIRSKLGGQKQEPPQASSKSEPATTKPEGLEQKETSAGKSAKVTCEQLTKEVANMEVNDNKPAPAGANLAEDEAQRAAIKIQAGFKGYKTRKELEGVIGSGQAPNQDGRQQSAKS